MMKRGLILPAMAAGLLLPAAPAIIKPSKAWKAHEAQLLANFLPGMMPSFNRASAGSFTPASLFSTYSDGFWLDANLGTCTDAAGTTPTTSDAATILNWQDQSGKGRHYSHASIGATRKNSIVNSLPVLRGPGGAGGARLDGSSIASWTEGEIFAVVACFSDPVPSAQDSAIWELGSSALACHYPYTSGVIYPDFGITTQTSFGDPSPSLTSFHILNQWSKTSDFGVQINRAAHSSTSSSLTVGFASSPHIFCDAYSGFGFSFKGDIAEIVAVNAKLTSTERTNMQNYLSAKYAVTLT